MNGVAPVRPAPTAPVQPPRAGGGGNNRPAGSEALGGSAAIGGPGSRGGSGPTINNINSPNSFNGAEISGGGPGRGGGYPRQVADGTSVEIGIQFGGRPRLYVGIENTSSSPDGRPTTINLNISYQRELTATDEAQNRLRSMYPASGLNRENRQFVVGDLDGNNQNNAGAYEVPADVTPEQLRYFPRNPAFAPIDENTGIVYLDNNKGGIIVRRVPTSPQVAR